MSENNDGAVLAGLEAMHEQGRDPTEELADVREQRAEYRRKESSAFVKRWATRALGIGGGASAVAAGAMTQNTDLIHGGLVGAAGALQLSFLMEGPIRSFYHLPGERDVREDYAVVGENGTDTIEELLEDAPMVRQDYRPSADLEHGDVAGMYREVIEEGEPFHALYVEECDLEEAEEELYAFDLYVTVVEEEDDEVTAGRRYRFTGASETAHLYQQGLPDDDAGLAEYEEAVEGIEAFEAALEEDYDERAEQEMVLEHA